MDMQEEMPNQQGPPALPPKKRNRLGQRIWAALPWWLLVLCLCFVVWVLMDQIQMKSEAIKKQKAAALKSERPAINVVALSLAPEVIEDRLNLPGVVRPFVELKVLTEVRGKILKKHVSEGAYVQKGDLLVTLDDKDYVLALSSARASYSAAIASKKRLGRLYKEKLATRSQIDDITAQVDSLKAAMDTAELNVGRCQIQAPMSGVANMLYVENGQYLNVADPVVDIIQIDRVKVTVGIPESDVDAVRRLDTFTLSIDALADRNFSGKRHMLSKTADAAARLYQLDIAVDNPQGAILPDMFARVHIVKKRIPEALTIPLFSVINKENAHFAYVVNDEHAHERPLHLGILDGWRIQVKDGLNPGDRVIVVGHRRVSEGTPVHVVRTVSDLEEIHQ